MTMLTAQISYKHDSKARTCCALTDGDRQVLQSTLHANFTPAATQDMTNGDPSQTYGLRPGKVTVAATLTQPSGPATQLSAAAAPLLAASAGRFASSGTVEGGEQATAGLQVRKTTTPAPQAKASKLRQLYNTDALL